MLTQLLWDIILQVGGHEELKALVVNGLLWVVFGKHSFSMELLQNILEFLSGIFAVLLQLSELCWAQTHPASVTHPTG